MFWQIAESVLSWLLLMAAIAAIIWMAVKSIDSVRQEENEERIEREVRRRIAHAKITTNVQIKWIER